MSVTVGDLLLLLTDSFTYVYIYSYDNFNIYEGFAINCANCNNSYIKGFDVGENEHGSYINIEIY